MDTTRPRPQCGTRLTNTTLWLEAHGAVMGVAGTPVQVRNHDDAGVSTTAGAFLRSELPIAGFALIEAASVEEAVARVSGISLRRGARSRGSVASGVVVGVEFDAVEGGSGLCDSCPAAGGVTGLSFGMPAHRRNPSPRPSGGLVGCPPGLRSRRRFGVSDPARPPRPRIGAAPKAHSDVTRKYQFERLGAAHPAALRLPHLPGAGGRRPKAWYPGTLLTTLLEGGAVPRRRQPTAHRSRTPCYRLPTSMCHVSHDTDVEGCCLMPLAAKRISANSPAVCVRDQSRCSSQST